MGNRKYAFGCIMQMGDIVENRTESPVLKEIFCCYLKGTSLNAITDWLRSQPVPYDTDKLWNKNMVARILADERYTGINGYPQLIAPEDFKAVQEIRSTKSSPDKRTDAQKILCRLATFKVDAYTEQKTLDIINRIITSPDILQCQTSTQATNKVTELQRQLDLTMSVNPIDEEKAKALIFQIASEKYSQINNSDYETEHLKRLFSGLEYMSELTAEILKTSISAVLVSNKKVSVQLKNGQVIEGVN